MERRVANSFPGPRPQAPYYHNNNYNGFSQYPQNDNRDQRFNQPQHYPNQQQNPTVDNNNNNSPLPPSSGCSSPSGSNSRKRQRSQSTTGLSSPTDTVDIVAKLYVSAVTKTATEDDIRQVFEKYGSVIEIILPWDKMTGERTSYCFVKYKKLEEANAAITALTDKYTFPGEMIPVRVKYADAERERERISNSLSAGKTPDKLYVSSLNRLTTKVEVNEVFSTYGVVEDIYMAFDEMKMCRGYAFVQFSHREMAVAAIKALNGLFTIRGSDQPLTVRFADPKKPRLGEGPRFSFNTPHPLNQFDSNLHTQPYSQWGNKQQYHDFASHPNHFHHQQNAQANITSHSNGFAEDQKTESTECDWSEHTCPEGNKYYFNCLTTESTWEKPDEYIMFERWYEEQTKLQDQKIVTPQSNNQSQEAIARLLQSTPTLEQPTTDDEKNLVHTVTSSIGVETICS